MKELMLVILCFLAVGAYGKSDSKVPTGSKLFISQMDGGLDGFVAAEILKKKLPITVVTDEKDAEFVLTGGSQKADDHWYNTVFNGKDKFLPGKIAISLVEFLLSLPPNDPRLSTYLKDFREVARLTVDDPNDTWGAYYSILALDQLRQAGLLQQAVDRLTLAKLRVRLDWRMFVDVDDFTLIDHPNNYYCVALGIARLRKQMGWEDGAGAQKIYDKIVDHYRQYSGDYGFADETNGDGRFDRYSVLLSAELAHHFVETSERPPPEVLVWLRKSADVMLPRLHEDGSGFEYGRSLGPYGETAIIEVLTIAATLDVLSESEKVLAYTYASRAAQRYFAFWINPKTGSVDLWDAGRRTDDYRGKFRVLGENLSLAHQYVYTNSLWSAMGFKDKMPIENFADGKLHARSAARHAKILDAIEAMDGNAAERAMILVIEDGLRDATEALLRPDTRQASKAERFKLVTPRGKARRI